MKRKRILLVAEALKKGGMERQLINLVDNYDRDRFHISILLFGDEIQYDIPKDVEVKIIRRRSKMDIIWFLRLCLEMTKYDVVNAKISGINEIILASSIFSRNKNIVCEVRNSGNKLTKFHKRSRFLIKLFRMKPVFLVNSEKAFGEVRSFLPQVKILRVKNGISHQKFSNHSVSDRPKTELLLGSVGRVERQKNFHSLIEAFASLDQTNLKSRLVLACGFIQDDDYYKDLKSLIKKLGIENRVSWSFDITDISSFYQKLDLFVLNSYHEGTPNVLLEAMLCEKVCLVSKGANVDSFFEGDFLIKNNEDVDEISFKLTECLTLNKSEKQIIGFKNREFVKSHYDIDQMIETYESVYSNFKN